MAHTTARFRGCLMITSVLVVCFIGAAYAKDDARPVPGCTVASSTDNLVGMTQFMGNKNTSDSLWHDELPYFRQHGPISKFTLYRAFFYDGIWHDPGELKGMQFWYGDKQQPPIYTYLDGDSNLFGARKPHIPQEFTLQEGELITKVELQWDPISMRYAVFTTNKGRNLSWGFKDVAGATKAVAEAPVPGAYVAAIRGFEGKPAPVSKKRYIIQVSIVWAVPSCKPPGASPGGSIPLEASRLASSKAAQGPNNVYLWDKETVDLIPEGIEGATVVYEGVTITKGAEGVPVPTVPAASSGQGSVSAPVPSTPAQGSKGVQYEKTPAEKPATQQAAAKEAAAQQTGSAAAQKDAYAREQRDPAVARKAVHKRPPPQQQQQGDAAEEVPVQIVASTRQPASGAKQAVVPPKKPAGQGAPAQQAVPAQQQVPDQQPGRWGKTWSILLG